MPRKSGAVYFEKHVHLETTGDAKKEKDIFLLKMSIKTHLITLSHFIFFSPTLRAIEKRQ